MNSLLMGRVGGSWFFLGFFRAFLVVAVRGLGTAFTVFCFFAGRASSSPEPLPAPGAFLRGLLIPLSDLGCLGFRERDGLPWGFPDQPAPVPVKTRTRSHGYGSWVL